MANICLADKPGFGRAPDAGNVLPSSSSTITWRVLLGRCCIALVVLPVSLQVFKHACKGMNGSCHGKSSFGKSLASRLPWASSAR